MSLIASEATYCAAELASSSPVHYCCFCCGPKSGPRLPKIRTADNPKANRVDAELKLLNPPVLDEEQRLSVYFNQVGLSQRHDHTRTRQHRRARCSLLRMAERSRVQTSHHHRYDAAHGDLVRHDDRAGPCLSRVTGVGCEPGRSHSI